MGCSGLLIEKLLVQLLIVAIEDMAKPVMNSSISEACMVSLGDGFTDMAATVGLETQEGGPSQG